VRDEGEGHLRPITRTLESLPEPRMGSLDGTGDEACLEARGGRRLHWGTDDSLDEATICSVPTDAVPELCGGGRPRRESVRGATERRKSVAGGRRESSGGPTRRCSIAHPRRSSLGRGSLETHEDVDAVGDAGDAGDAGPSGAGTDTDCDNSADVEDLPCIFVPKRRAGLSAEAYGGWNQRRATYNPPVSEITAEQRSVMTEGLRNCPFFCSIDSAILNRIADSMFIERYAAGERILEQGDTGRSGYLLLEGECLVYDTSRQHNLERKEGTHPTRGTLVRTVQKLRFFGEMTMLWGLRRSMSVYASTDCVLAKLKRDSYMGLVTRGEMLLRTQREEILRRVDMFETLSDEHISQIADALERKTFEPGENIIRQGEKGKEFYVVLSGECSATIMTGQDLQKADIQEHRRYHPGDLFGERALLHNTTRAATVTAVSRVEVLCLKRSRFERMLGPLEMLQQTNYLSDPRKKMADFYKVGDQNGPLGSLAGPPNSAHPTAWFAVYRPTSRDAIAKMLSGKAVGKGLNVKGKSAKKNRMSGFVPYLQISKEEHKYMIEESSPSNRLTIYYVTKAACSLALTTLQEIEGAAETIKWIDRFQPDVYGLEMPEHVMRKAYILAQNITFLSGWETGRQSEPAFMDMNLHAVCGQSEPEVVLYQMDSENPMNPHALLIAYAEATVKPVVSDFDTFTIGSRGMQYAPLPEDQQHLACWALDNTEKILGSPSKSSWNSRWLEVLKEANEKGFHPTLPKYGFGDKTSYHLIEAVVDATRESGAVRHGAECFNFYFPQELDEDYLVVWEEFPDKPWQYMDEDDLREFLLERVDEGYSFPLNPVWPVRDTGWYEVYEALWENEDTRGQLLAWYPPESGIKEKIEAIHERFPDCFFKEFTAETGKNGASLGSRMSMVEDLDSCERADLLMEKARQSRWHVARRKMEMARVLSRLRSSVQTTAPVEA